MAAEGPVTVFPMDKEAAEEEIALLVRKPGFGQLTVGDIIRHMNNRFNLDFAAFKKDLKKMVFDEIAKKNQEEGSGSDESSSSSDSDSDEDEARKEPEKEAEEQVKQDSDSDHGVEDAKISKKKQGSLRAQTDMASNIKSSRRAAASEAMKSIRSTSGGRFKGQKKEKDPNADNSGRFGPMTKLCYISPELQEVTKDQWMKRCDVVKVLWDYIKEKNLKDPKQGQFVICDDVLENIFKKKRFKAFTMAKFLTKHVIGTTDMAPEMREEAEKEMDKRREEWKQRQAQRAKESRESNSEEREEPESKKMKKEEESDNDDDDDTNVDNKAEDDKESSSSDSD